MNTGKYLYLFLSPRRTARLWLLCVLMACAWRVSAAGVETSAIPRAAGVETSAIPRAAGVETPAIPTPAGVETLAIPTADGVMTVYLYRPAADARDMPVVMVMHGVKRDGAQARDQWIDAANRYHFLIIAPEFPSARYPGARGYMLGNTAAGNAVRPVDQWSYSRIGDVFNALRRDGITRRGDYLLYGHSAGCQFVHRMLMALPDTPARAVVCASAGWWTPPDASRSWPYGLARAPFTLDAVHEARFFARPTLIMVGGKDTLTQRTAMRKTPQAQAQGNTRLERAGWYFRIAQSLAKQQAAPFNWHFIIVAGAGHQSPLLVAEAARFLNQFK